VPVGVPRHQGLARGAALAAVEEGQEAVDLVLVGVPDVAQFRVDGQTGDLDPAGECLAAGGWTRQLAEQWWREVGTEHSASLA